MNKISVRDVGLHVILGAILTIILYAIRLVLGLRVPLWGVAMDACVVLFVRELTQVQARYHENNFFKGWNASEEGVFNLHHTAEWLAPAIVVLLLAVALAP